MLKANVQIKGNLGRAPEAQYTPQGKLVCKFSVAVNHGSGDKQETDWYNCVVWEKSAELFNNLATAGTHVLISGRQRIKNWTDKEGVKHTQVEITVTDFDILGKGKKKEESDDLPSEDDMPF